MAERLMKDIRSRFDLIYNCDIIGAGFAESDEYYRRDKERYWRCLVLLCQLDLQPDVKLLEIGGGQLAVICKKMFGYDCTVADVSERYISPLQRGHIEFFKYNLMDLPPVEKQENFDVVVMLEVIEHIPAPAYILFERIKLFLKPTGIMFLTTPNLFRIRNVVRMILGIEFLDDYQIPEREQGLGHQLEYSAKHLRWQLERGGMQIMVLNHDELGRVGHSFKTRLGRSLVAPLAMLRPKWRDGLVAVARKSFNSTNR